MSLEKVRATKKESADYMVNEITHIIKTFGKRDPGRARAKNKLSNIWATF